MSKSTERVDQFLQTFNHAKNEIEVILSAVTPNDSAVADELQKLEKFLSESAAFIPPYTCKMCQESVESLRRKINDNRVSGIPKKRFTFGKKSAPALPVTTAKEAKDSLQDDTNRSSMLGRRSLRNETLTLTREEFHQRDFELESLVNCTIHLPGSPMTLILRKLDNCTINCGPVSSSIYIDGCHNCIFAFAFQQLRIHSSSECKFYVFAKTKPILENCTAMSFGAFNYTYENLAQDMQDTGFTDETENFYDQVVDFDWLSSDKSPNWCLL